MKNWTKMITLILLPINAWLCVFLYLNHQKAKYLEASHSELIRKDEMVVAKFLREKYGIRVDQQLQLPLHRPLVGSLPPLGKGYPVCFINISGLTFPEIWEPIISEALKVSPYLYVALLHPVDGDLATIKKMVQKINDPRLSAISLDLRVERILGGYRGGILLILCDGKGVIKAIESYPSLKVTPHIEKEIADWRPKLHQAVKRALEKFFGKPSGKQDG
jgi:hypothetical protein